MSNLPDKNKDCIQGVVRLKHSMTNAAGQSFAEGQLMIISKRKKGKGTVELRPLRGGIICTEDNVDFLGNKTDLGFESNQ